MESSYKNISETQYEKSMELLVTSENYLKVYNHSVFESLKDIIEEMRKTKDERIEFLESENKKMNALLFSKG